MKVVAVKDHSVPFQVEMPLEVEKSVAARAFKLKNNPTTRALKKKSIFQLILSFQLLFQNERLNKFHPKQLTADVCITWTFNRASIRSYPAMIIHSKKSFSVLPIHDDGMSRIHASNPAYCIIPHLGYSARF
jgi:hypothetical protein